MEVVLIRHATTDYNSIPNKAWKNFSCLTNDLEKFKEKYLYTIARHGGFNYCCNKCNKCLNNCPNNIDIPSFLEEINEVTRKI